ncbi:MAG: flagellar filament capping protein FliD [Acidimicrobiales bacterium]|nr:flagellar filament capping protein FliD [Acidimicrobiales bacterium]
MSSSFSVGGIASGLDTSSIISELMFAARAPVRRLENAKAAEQLELTSWQSLGSRLTSLKSKLTSFTTGTALQAVNSSSSDETIVRATASAGALPGTYAFQVTSLAAAQQTTSTGLASSTATVGAGTALVSRGTGAIGIDTLDASALTSGAYEIEVLSVADGQATVVFDGVEQTVSATGGATLTAGDSSTLTLGAGTSLAVGTASLVAVQTDGSSTLVNLREGLNAAGSPVRAQLIDTGDGTATPWRLVLTSTATGTDNSLDTDLSGLSAFSGGLTEVRAASDAVLTLGSGGLTVTRSSNVLDDVFDGLRLDLRSAAPGADVEVTVTDDVDSRFAAIKDVIDQVNIIFGKITQDSKYDVETGASGPLVGNFAARQLSRELQSALGQVVSGGDYVLLGQVGITIQNDGTYKVDETVLRSALGSSPEAVAELLTGDAATSSNGAFDILLGTVENLLANDGLVDAAKDSSESSITEFDAAIASHEVRMEQVQARYTRQFAALEALMGQMQSQSAYLTSALAKL